MATKKAIKAVPAVSVRKPRAKKVVASPIYWVLSERTKLFVWRPIKLYSTQDAAVAARTKLEEVSPYSLNGYKVDRVTLVA